MRDLLGALNLMENPIFIKCCRLRLRPKNLLGWGTATFIITGLIFLGVYATTSERRLASEMMAARAAFVPVLFIQAFILILLGIIWGGAFTTTSSAVETLHPLTVALMRLLIGAALLLPVALSIGIPSTRGFWLGVILVI